MVSQGYAYLQTHQIVYIKYVQLFNINHASIKRFLKEKNIFQAERKAFAEVWHSEKEMYSGNCEVFQVTGEGKC